MSDDAERPLDLTVRHGLELLGRLQETVARCAADEAALRREARSQLYNVERDRRAASQRLEDGMAARRMAIEADFAAAADHLETVRDGRRDRIEAAHEADLASLQSRAKRAAEERFGELQMRHFVAVRQLPVDLANAATEHAAATAQLAMLRTRLGVFERRSRRQFFGYPAFLRLLRRRRPEPTPAAGPAAAADRDHLVLELATHLGTVEAALGTFGGFVAPQIFRFLPPFVVVPALLLAPLAAWAGGWWPAAVAGLAAGLAVPLAAALLAVHRRGRRQAAAAAAALAAAIARAHELAGLTALTAAAALGERRQAIERAHAVLLAKIDEQWGQVEGLAADFMAARASKYEGQLPRLIAHNAHLYARRRQHCAELRTARLAAAEAAAAGQRQEGEAAATAATDRWTRDETERWTALVARWRREVVPIYETLAAMDGAAAASAPPWSEELAAAWTPAAEYPAAVRFGRLELALDRALEALPADPRLALPGPPLAVAPLALALPAQGSLLIETDDSGGPETIATLHAIMLRLLLLLPPGRLSFTIIDPVGLGQHFAGFMHLGDYEESLINRRIWTQREQIEARLGELNEHLEKVIQMYLRDEFPTVAEYNRQAGSVAEKYHFVVVADFPAGFSDAALRRLQSIAASGPRCGVFTLVHRDRRQPPPEGAVAAELQSQSVHLERRGDGWAVAGHEPGPGWRVALDPGPPPVVAAALIHAIGRGNIDAGRVELPFAQIVPGAADRWAPDATRELRVAIGRTGATKLQCLALGTGTRHHALLVGKTGAGKSTLFHVIITNLALTYSPDQVEFYLIDFKKGVEFKGYAERRLPHARVVAIESDREFALSVLERVDAELKRRGDLFRGRGVQDLAGYRQAGGAGPLPRTLLIIDEFQEFFVEDDAVAQQAAVLFDRIVRQGRAFGIHVLLGSQTLGGAYTLARTTLGQMTVRIALQCNEADAYLIMDENNAAPRLLSRPGEGIYNDAAGAVEGNSPFQVAWLPEAERDQWLAAVDDLAAAARPEDRAGDGGRGRPGPFVFEGNAPADIRDNDPLRAALAAAPAAPPAAAHCWLGAPNSIKGPTAVTFHCQTGRNLLIVGQRDDAALALLTLAALALAAQYPAGAARYYFLTGAPPGSPDAAVVAGVAAAMGGELRVVGGAELPAVMAELAAEVRRRAAGGGPEQPPVFFFIHGLQRFKKLRQEDEFGFGGSPEGGEAGPAAAFTELLVEGAAHGVHLLVAVDAWSNVSRFLSRRALGEFGLRVVFQMGANDSVSLIDAPQAAGLGLYRAILFDEQQGSLETFRPYAIPDGIWLRATADHLRARTRP